MAGSGGRALALIWRHADALSRAGAGGRSAGWLVDELGYRVLHAVDRAERGVATTADAAWLLRTLASLTVDLGSAEVSVAEIEAERDALRDYVHEVEAEARGLRVLLGVERIRARELEAEARRQREIRRAMLNPAAGLRFVAAWIRGGDR